MAAASWGPFMVTAAIEALPENWSRTGSAPAPLDVFSTGARAEAR